MQFLKKWHVFLVNEKNPRLVIPSRFPFFFFFFFFLKKVKLSLVAQSYI
jgi:hypothetical protein